MSYTYNVSGERITYTNAGSAISAGDIVQVGKLGLAVALDDIANGATGTLILCGVHEKAAASAATWSQGDPLFWDTDNSQFTSDPGTTPYLYFGPAARAKTNGQTTAFAKLEPFGSGVALRRNVVPLTSFRVHDALQTNLPGTAATDDLALIGGTLGTNSPEIESVDFGGTTTTAYARTVAALPAGYVPGSPVTLRVRAGMKVISDGTATVDAQVYRHDGDGGVSADLCETDAQSCNSATEANLDFVITPTACLPGDQLDIRLAVAGSDTGNAAADIAARITSVELLCIAA